MATMKTSQAGWRFWLWWMLATIAGLFVYTVISFPLVLVTQTLGRGADVLQLALVAIGGGLLGAALGMAQWLVLRRELKNVGGWVLATLSGYAATSALRWIVIPDIGWVVALNGVLLDGGMLGAFQWFVLRRRLQRAWLWIAISLLSWSAAITLSATLPLGMLLITTAIAGGGMVWLLRRHAVRTAAPSKPEPSTL